MRILHVIADLAQERGGPAEACIHMARGLAERGHEVRVLATDRGMRRGQAPWWAESLGGVRLDIDLFPLQFPAFFATSLPLGRAIEAAVRTADVVHLHSLYLFHDAVTGRYCRKFGVPYIVRPHGTLDPYIWRRHRMRKRIVEFLFQDRVLQGAAAIHYTTEEEMRLAALHARNAKGFVVPIGLDFAAFAPRPSDRFRARWKEVGNRRILLFLGRLHPKKGLDVLAEAFAAMATARDDVHLVVAGPDDGAREPTEAALRRLGVRDRTTFTGMLRGEDKLDAFYAADVFLLPSYSENFGIAVVEAMACGVPVVVSDQVNLWREVVGAGAAVPCEAPAVATAATKLLDDPAARVEAGRRGAAFARDRYDRRRVAAELEAAYETARAGVTPRSGDVSCAA
jgi:glycosyltransferase involved in cell wall biosynthesis